MATQLVSNPTTTCAPAKRIMIVEDESVISLDIKNSLIRLGYDIAGIAASGDSALTKIQNSQPDLILMDIQLKGTMSGIDVSQKVKEDFQIPVVYLTANADSRTFKAANQTDPYGYLLKPFEERELEIAIEIALHKHEKEQIIRSSERWYATAFQSLSEAVIATDRQGDVVFMNTLAESITGWPLAEAIDCPIVDILRLRRKIQQPDTVGRSNSITSILKAALELGTAGTEAATDSISLPHQAQLLTKALQVVSVDGQAIALRDTTGYVIGSLFTFKPNLADKAAEHTRANPSPAASSQSLSKLAANSDLDRLESQALHQTPYQAPDQAKDQAQNQAKKSIGQREINCIKTFIESFISGNPTFLASGDLIASYDKEVTTLTSRLEGPVITGKLVRDSLTAIVNRSSIYWEIVCHDLIESSFFPVSQRTNGTCYFQHCTIPKDAQVYRTSAYELWEVWHGKACPNESYASASASALGPKVSRSNLVVLRRGSWYHIQSLSISNDIVKIKTAAGEIFTSAQSLLVWGTQLWQ